MHTSEEAGKEKKKKKTGFLKALVRGGVSCLFLPGHVHMHACIRLDVRLDFSCSFACQVRRNFVSLRVVCRII